MILAILLSPLSAIFGRCGGMSKDAAALPKWIPVWLRQRWVRPAGCSICAILPIAILHPSWWLIPALGALYGALSLYWDELFGFDNMWFSGFMCGVAGLFLLTLFPLHLIIIRAFVLAIGWGLINLYCNKKSVPDGTEELARYGFLSLTTIILLS